MASSVKDIDRGWRALIKRAGLKQGLTVGIHDEEGAATDGSGPSVAQVATWNEFGTEHIPERSFLRSWFDETREKNLADARKVVAYVVKRGGNIQQALNQMGLKFVSDIQNKIVAGVPPPNAPSTVARKGSSTPLVDTGQLKSSIRHKIE